MIEWNGETNKQWGEHWLFASGMNEQTNVTAVSIDTE